MPDEPWYAEGLRFSCTRCGNCCRSHGEHAWVYLADEDVEALAAHLGLTVPDFLERHCVEDEGWTVLRSEGPACRFLGEDERCTVYEARPMQCRTWPFWEENVKRRTTWEGPIRETCPGIGTGELFSAREVEATVRANEAWQAEEGPGEL